MTDPGTTCSSPLGSISTGIHSLTLVDENVDEVAEGEMSPLFHAVDDPFAYLQNEDVDQPGSNSESLEAPRNVNIPKARAAKETNDLIGLGEIPLQEYIKIAREGTEFTILVAGDRGLGKTTFINTLFEPIEVKGNLNETQGLENRTTKFELHRSLLKDSNFRLTLPVIDTPGFFDTTNNKFSWVPIANYIDDQIRLRCFQEEQPERGKMVDSRVHACIYFITPCSNGLTESDMTAMKHLCKRVNLIPVISKADTFTKDQLFKYKKLAQLSIEQNEIKLSHMLSTEAQIDIPSHMMPFSIIGAESYVARSNGELVRGRAYNWGVAEVENESHCDFNQLKEILMSSHMIEFIEGTNNHYENFRIELLMFRLQQLLKVNDNEAVDLDEDLDDEAIEKIKLEEKNVLLDRALKSDNSFDFIQDLHKVTWDTIDKIFAEQNPIFVESQQLIKRNFASIVCAQEKKFKEWKGALILKQKLFNEEVQKMQGIVAHLQESIEALELEYEESAPLSRGRTTISQEG